MRDRRSTMMSMVAVLLASLAARAQPSPFEPGEELKLSVHYLAMNAGDLSISVGRGQQDGVDTWPLELRCRTRGLTDSMISVRQTFISHYAPADGRSLGWDSDASVDGEPQQEHVR